MDLVVGQIILTALDFAPTGTLACNGASVATSAYPSLSALLGTAYGSNGTGTFGIPNIAPVHTTAGATLNWVIVTEGAPFASGMEALLGEVRLFPVAAPAGSTLAATWSPCDGQLQYISANSALFALLGTTFGGDGEQTFLLPKLAQAAVSNGPALSYWISTEGLFPPLGGNSILPTQGDTGLDAYIAAVLQLPYVAPSITGQLNGLGVCLGQTMPLAQWTAIFSLLGTRFGGNGTTNFLLPNRPAGSDNVTYEMLLNGYYPPRS